MASKAGNTFVDLLERCGWTAVQVALGTWLTLQSRGGGWDAYALKAAGAAALLNAVKVLVLSGYTPHPGANPGLDTLKRVAWTLVLAVGGAWLALEQQHDAWNAAIVLDVAKNAGAIALVKCILALNLGQTHSAAALPASVDPQPVDPYLVPE